VQPNSGQPGANQGVFQALLQPGDTILGMSLDAGGSPDPTAPSPNQSASGFNAVQYGCAAIRLDVDYDQIAEMATEHQPKMTFAGGLPPSRASIGLAKKCVRLPDSVAPICWWTWRISPRALVATGAYPSPFRTPMSPPLQRIKLLRGPRGGMILTNDEALAKKFNSAIFPGIQVARCDARHCW